MLSIEKCWWAADDVGEGEAKGWFGMASFRFGRQNWKKNSTVFRQCKRLCGSSWIFFLPYFMPHSQRLYVCGIKIELAFMPMWKAQRNVYHEMRRKIVSYSTQFIDPLNKYAHSDKIHRIKILNMHIPWRCLLLCQACVCAIALCKESQHFDNIQVNGWIKQIPRSKVYTIPLVIGFYFPKLVGTSRHRSPSICSFSNIPMFTLCEKHDETTHCHKPNAPCLYGIFHFCARLVCIIKTHFLITAENMNNVRI